MKVYVWKRVNTNQHEPYACAFATADTREEADALLLDQLRAYCVSLFGEDDQENAEWKLGELRLAFRSVEPEVVEQGFAYFSDMGAV
jgi:hypothetical protein